MKASKPMSIKRFAELHQVDIAKLDKKEFKQFYRKYVDYQIKREELLERQKARQ